MVVLKPGAPFESSPEGGKGAALLWGRVGANLPLRGLSMCKAVVCGRGIMAQACEEMASAVAAQLFLESAQLPPRSSRLFLRDSRHAGSRRWAFDTL